jgi:ParB-like chromosome segregation protein Spo0J
MNDELNIPVSILTPIDTFDPAPYNPQIGDQHEMESLQRSIDQFGFGENVVLNDRLHSGFMDGSGAIPRPVLVSGHKRVIAAKALGYTAVPAVTLSLSPTEEKAMNIAMNRIHGTWDETLLAELVAEIHESESEMLDYTGLNEKELDNLLNEQALRVPDEPDEDEPEKAKSSAGKFDVQQLRVLAEAYGQDTPAIHAFCDWVEKRVTDI